MIDYLPADFDPSGGVYGDDWILLRVTEEDDYSVWTGKACPDLFQLVVSKRAERWELRVMDFLEYEGALKRYIMVAAELADLAQAERAYQGHHHREACLRTDESPILVHTTDAAAYQGIVRDGCVKSWNRLHTGMDKPIGALLGDPPDYRDYVMLGQGGYHQELVVLSRQVGRIVMDAETSYRPGARLYFDAAAIAADGLLVRDGAHVKVRDALPLEPYLLKAVTPETVGLTEVTTPRAFAEKADAMFGI